MTGNPTDAVARRLRVLDMDAGLPSGSEWPRVMACPPSAVLPHAHEESGPWADAGIGKHTFLMRVGQLQTLAAQEGIECLEGYIPQLALREVPEEHHTACEQIRLDLLPLGPGFVPELAVVIDLETGTAREAGRGIDRAYGPLRRSEIACTIDVARWEGMPAGRGYVGDYKTGFSTQQPARDHWQLRVEALALALLFDLQVVDAALIQVQANGYPTEDAVTWTRMDLEFFMMELRVMADETLPLLREGLAVGITLDTRAGEHCRYCPAYKACPTKVGLMMAAVQKPDAVEMKFRNLMDADVQQAYKFARAVHELGGRLMSEVSNWARERPITLQDGTVYGEDESEVRTLNGTDAYSVVAEVLGSEYADMAVHIEATQASIKRAVEAAKGANAETPSGTITHASQNHGAPGGPRWCGNQDAPHAEGTHTQTGRVDPETKPHQHAVRFAP